MFVHSAFLNCQISKDLKKKKTASHEVELADLSSRIRSSIHFAVQSFMHCLCSMLIEQCGTFITSPSKLYSAIYPMSNTQELLIDHWFQPINIILTAKYVDAHMRFGFTGFFSVLWAVINKKGVKNDAFEVPKYDIDSTVTRVCDATHAYMKSGLLSATSCCVYEACYSV